jgi:KDO2-lipid IV(A) lauroyltransferase
MLIAILKGFSWFISALPLNAALSVGRGLGWIYGSLIRYHRQDAITALRRSLPEKTESERRRILKTMYRNLGMNIVEEFRMQHISEEDLKRCITWEGDQHARDVLTAGKGVIVLSAHLGNWDILCTMAPKFNFPATIITKKIKNKALNQFWMEARSRFGLKFVPAHNS